MPSAAPIPIVHAIVLGVVQGLTEFFPISSSGHLILVPWLLGWNDLQADADFNKTFDVALHMGTFIGAAAYFAPDLGRFAKAGIGSIARRRIETPDERMAWLLLVSSFPGAAVGAILENFIENNLGEEWLIAVMLIVFGLLLAVADRRPGLRGPNAQRGLRGPNAQRGLRGPNAQRGRRRSEEFGVKDAATMGIMQALALAPGVSRSGVTITGARWLGFERDAAARLSFLMSLPIIGGAGLYKGVKVLAAGGLPPGTGGAFAAGMITSAITGGLAVWGTIRFLRSHSFTPFVVYRVVAGLAVLGLLASRFR